MYIVEGNIGAGKSTFLKLLTKQAPEISIVLEPVYNWQDKTYGESLLANFYQQPKRWAYTFETLTMMCRVKEHLLEQENTNPNRIFERSIYSGHYCFAKNSFANNFLSAVEWHMYTDWFNFLVPNRCQNPLGFIYLRTAPDICYERAKKRNRSAEKTLQLSYLKQLHQRHDDFLIEKTQVIPQLKETPVLILDCDQEFEADSKKFQEHVAAVQKFLTQTQTTFTPARATEKQTPR
ncbi:hypothetical protein CVU75_01055 [Candidatus Dependentiae bacterium HGW-Dependentiae-1]|nr:MAG: hypothetical protein CVU75_01055 [Candidatus Dependentiae bacterium HGW-Dependentiae-1]